MIFLKFIISLVFTCGFAILIVQIDEKRNDILGNHKLSHAMFVLEVFVGAFGVIALLVAVFLLVLCVLVTLAMFAPEIFTHEVYEALMSM